MSREGSSRDHTPMILVWRMPLLLDVPAQGRRSGGWLGALTGGLLLLSGVPVLGLDEPGARTAETRSVPPPESVQEPVLVMARDPFADATGTGWTHRDGAWSAAPDAGPLAAGRTYANFRLHLDYRLPEGQAASLEFGTRWTLPLPAAPAGAAVEVIWEQVAGRAGKVRAAREGRVVTEFELPAATGTGSAAPVSGEAFGEPGVATGWTLRPAPGLVVRRAWLQPLDRADHAGLIRASDDGALARGARIYAELCVVCHGTPEKEGTLPTALRFHQAPFRNGGDPYSMYRTLTLGFGQMVAQGQYSARQKYDVIHYIRETLVKPGNPGQYRPVTDAYLASLPMGMTTVPDEPPREQRRPQHELMDFGPSLAWTYEVAPGNFAYKGLAVRLDPGPGGISRGRAWMTYDHDTLRVAAGWAGPRFIDWRGIAFDGSHGTHASIGSAARWTTPPGPGWASPEGSWSDPRFLGRDGKPYGPLPRDWVRYLGHYRHGNRVAVHYRVGDAEVLETPGHVEFGAAPVFLRTLAIGRSSRDLALRLAATNGAVSAVGDGVAVREEGGFWVARIPAAATPLRARFGVARLDPASLRSLMPRESSEDPALLTRGGEALWDETVVTRAIVGANDGPFASDHLTVPDASANPWESWMRLGGFDFFPDGKRAAVCTWMGDVWIVDGLDAEPLDLLRWRRVATGLFQPLGLLIVDGVIHVTCRDQIARLHDLNGDGEVDRVECFNNDHQVTEHFHEFAMGLQRDAAGNFYYAKSARHALPALVPHHGTLLRVTSDGARTDILARGFRAANGVCLNPDGTFFVTDQEGHWMPKNRINWVRREGLFFGNMMGYHDVTDASDGAMEPPMVWITNEFDRSPAELLWVPEGAWGALGGRLLNLSYGYGRVYVVPHERVGERMQGAVCPLPIPDFPTGVMRGRFHPGNRHLYLCGMFAWAGNQTAPGGFYRLRATGRPMDLPVEWRAVAGGLELGFTDALDSVAMSDPSRYRVKAWDLKRSAQYGSRHLNERELPVTRAAPRPDGRGVRLDIPALAPTWGLEIRARVRGREGREVERVLHGTLH